MPFLGEFFDANSIIASPFVNWKSPINLLTMVPLYLCALMSVAIVIQRLLALRRGRILPVRLSEDVIVLLRRKNQHGALDRCKTDNSLLSCILGQGLEDFLSGVPASSAFLETGAKKLEVLNRGLKGLNLISRVSTQLGLFGTVAGMIISFQQIASQANPDKSMVAAGIATALITTALGLMIAIPTSVMESYFAQRADVYYSLFDDYLSEVIELLEPRRSGAEYSAADSKTAGTASDTISTMPESAGK